MSQVHENLERKEFEVPESVSKTYICTETGKLATNRCGSKVYEYIATDNMPEYCSTCVYVPPETETETETDSESDTVTPAPDTTPPDTTPVPPAPDTTPPAPDTTPQVTPVP